MRNKWTKKYDFYDDQLSGNTHYVLDDREQILESELLPTNDIYFKYQKCINGVCYSYIKDLNNIYDKSILTGDGNSINNMYNEYNIIDKYVENLIRVDIATNEQIDLNLSYHKIDNIEIKPNHLILLFNQNNKINNDIYIVTKDYKLIKNQILGDDKKSYRAKFYVKLGTNKDTQFFLENDSIIFPIESDEKTFNNYHSYILKHKLNYDINNTGETSKLLFSDYQIARHLQDPNISYQPITFEFVNTNLIYEILMSSQGNYDLTLLSGYDYNFVINWGDGNSDNYNSSGPLAANDTISHNYLTPGTKQITIIGIFEALYFENSTLITKVISFGNSNNLSYANFKNSSLSSIEPGANISSIANLDYSFYNTNLTTLPSSLFHGNTTLTSLKFTFSNNNLTSIPNDLFSDAVNLLDLESSFENSNLSSIPSGLFDTNTKITNFKKTFKNNNLTSIPSNFLLHNIHIVSLESMFQNNQITALNLIFGYTPSLINMNYAFENNNIVNINNYFLNNVGYVKYLVGTFKNNEITSLFDMFFVYQYEIISLESTFENNKLTSIDNKLIYNLYHLLYPNIIKTEILSVKNTFKNNEISSNLTHDFFKYATKITDFTGTFQNNQITTLESNIFVTNTAAITFESTFENNHLTTATSFNNLSVVNSFKNTFKDNYITSTISNMFNGCSNDISSLSILNFNSSSNATSFKNTFKDNLIATINYNMFAYCSNIVTLESAFENNQISDILDINIISDCTTNPGDTNNCKCFIPHNNSGDIISLKYTFKNNQINNVPYHMFKGNANYDFTSTFENNLIGQNNNGDTSSELFYYNTLVTSFNSTFENNKITSIPTSIFNQNTQVLSFNNTFKTNLLTNTCVFTNNTLVTSFNATFEDNIITNIANNIFRANIFANNPLVTSFNSTFEDNKLSQIIDYGGLDETTSHIFSGKTNVISYNATFKDNQINNIPYYLFYDSTGCTSFISTFENNSLGDDIASDLFVNFYSNDFSDKLFQYNVNVISFNSVFKDNFNKSKVIQTNVFSACTSVTDFNYAFYNCSLAANDVEKLWTRYNSGAPYPNNITGVGCFGGNPNNNYPSNYSQIPSNWK